MQKYDLIIFPHATVLSIAYPLFVRGKLAKSQCIKKNGQRGKLSVFYCPDFRHVSIEIKKAQAFIEQHHIENPSVEALSEMFALSRRNFDRRFLKATGNTPSEYVRRVKIEAAKRELETGDKHIAEMMYATGCTDEKAFRTTFKKVTGLSPLEYRNRYHKPIC